MKLTSRRPATALTAAVAALVVVLGDPSVTSAAPVPTSSDVEIAVRVTSDGLGRFTADDRPGATADPPTASCARVTRWSTA